LDLEAVALSWLAAEDPERFLLWLRVGNGSSVRRERTTPQVPPVGARRAHDLEAALGGLFASLEARDVLRRTIAVVTAAPAAGGEHDSLRNRTARAPLLLFHPMMPAGGRNAAPVSTLDLAPTLAAFAGVSLDAPLDGVSWLDEPPDERLRLAIGPPDGSAVPLAAVRGPLELNVDCAAGIAVLVDASRGHHLPAGAEQTLKRDLLAEIILSLGGPPCPRPEVLGRAPGSLEDELEAASTALETFAARARNDRLWAEPPVAHACSGARGTTTLHWRVREAGRYAIRIGSVDGPRMANGPAVGSAQTGPWVHDRTDFFLVTADGTRLVAWTRVFVRPRECPAAPAAATPSTAATRE
jgi:hypothetical protein